MPLHMQTADRTLPEQADLPEPDLDRCIAIYWRDTAKERVPVGHKGRRKTVTVEVWRMHAFVFSALRPDHDNRPPETAEMAIKMSLQAYALAASHFPIPSDAVVLYEVRS